MRRDSSPAAMADAVSSIRDSGARLARISGNPMPASSTMAATPATVSAISSWPTGALHVVEADRGDDVAPAGHRPDQHPPRMPGGARGGGGERDGGAVQLRGGRTWRGDAAHRPRSHVHVAVGVDHFHQKSVGTVAPGRRGRGPGPGAGDHPASERRGTCAAACRPGRQEPRSSTVPSSPITTEVTMTSTAAAAMTRTRSDACASTARRERCQASHGAGPEGRSRCREYRMDQPWLAPVQLAPQVQMQDSTMLPSPSKL